MSRIAASLVVPGSLLTAADVRTGVYRGCPVTFEMDGPVGPIRIDAFARR
jgi:hypothetical protein